MCHTAPQEAHTCARGQSFCMHMCQSHIFRCARLILHLKAPGPRKDGDHLWSPSWVTKDRPRESLLLVYIQQVFSLLSQPSLFSCTLCGSLCPLGVEQAGPPPNYSLGQKVPAHELHRTNGLHLLRDVSPKDKHLLFGAALAPQLHQGWPNPVQPLVPALGDERRVKSSVTPKPNPQRTQFHTAWW